MTQLIATICLC